MDTCPECGSQQIATQKGEVFCLKCGLVLDQPFSENVLPSVYSSTHCSPNHSFTKKDLRYFSAKESSLYRLNVYLSIYTDGLPKTAKMRAKTLALKVLKTNLFSGQFKAVALACAQAAAEEINCNASILKKFLNNKKNQANQTKLKRKARAILQYMKKEGLYKPATPRDKVEEMIRVRCSLLGYDSVKCLELYYEHEKHLSKLSPRNAADVVCYLYSALHNCPPPPATEKRMYRMRNIARNLLIGNTRLQPKSNKKSDFTKKIEKTVDKK